MVAAVLLRVRRRDAAAAARLDPVLTCGSWPAVSAGQLAWIARMPAPALFRVCESLAPPPGGMLDCSGDGSLFR